MAKLLQEFSIQLYSLREETEKDFPAVLKKLGEIGYTGVEFAGYGDIPAEQMKALLDENGLRSIGAHVGPDRLRDHLDEELAYNKIIGSQYIICPWMDVSNKENAEEAAAFLNPVIEKIEQAGFIFAYHNHQNEFEKSGDGYPLDILFANLDNRAVMELDMYWAAYAGVDPIAYLRTQKGKAQLLHIKQIRDYETRECVDLNEGVLDFASIIAEAKTLGVKHFILEQEAFAVSAYQSVQNGYDYIMSLEA